MDGVCQIFEAKLKADNPHQKKITYDIADLFAFIDGMTDLATLTSGGTHTSNSRD